LVTPPRAKSADRLRRVSFSPILRVKTMTPPSDEIPSSRPASRTSLEQGKHPLFVQCQLNCVEA
jgi:hypothetical protein